MTMLQLLLVEDENDVADLYRELLEDYKKANGKQIEMRVCNSLSDAKSNLDDSIDAAVVDLNLGQGTTDGAEVIRELREHFRVPVAVLTGTPFDADREPPVIEVFTKGEFEFAEVLDRLWEPYNIGLTRIMGGRGLLEDRLNAVFLNNLLPTLNEWVRYGQDDTDRTEKALLRFTLGHLVANLDGDETPCYPEEVYLSPPLKKKLTTGSLVRLKSDDSLYVVMTPACDLVLRNGQSKASSIQCAKIQPAETVYATLGGNSKERKNKRDQLRMNNYRPCFHWLPDSISVSGGFLDFREVQSVPRDDFDSMFEQFDARIAPGFIKDIVFRFSAFYARQGQPEISSPAAS